MSEKSLFHFSRDVEDSLGNRYTQFAIVCASERAEADSILARRLEGHRHDQDESDAYAFASTPDWRMDEYALDESGLIALSMTQWPTGVPI